MQFVFIPVSRLSNFHQFCKSFVVHIRRAGKSCYIIDIMMLGKSFSFCIILPLSIHSFMASYRRCDVQMRNAELISLRSTRHVHNTMNHSYLSEFNFLSLSFHPMIIFLCKFMLHNNHFNLPTSHASHSTGGKYRTSSYNQFECHTGKAKQKAKEGKWGKVKDIICDDLTKILWDGLFVCMCTQDFKFESTHSFGSR